MATTIQENLHLVRGLYPAPPNTLTYRRKPVNSRIFQGSSLFHHYCTGHVFVESAMILVGADGIKSVFVAVTLFQRV